MSIRGDSCLSKRVNAIAANTGTTAALIHTRGMMKFANTGSSADAIHVNICMRRMTIGLFAGVRHGVLAGVGSTSAAGNRHSNCGKSFANTIRSKYERLVSLTKQRIIFDC